MQNSEFDKYVEEWKKMDYNSSDEKAAASTFYDEHIFPYVKEAFVSNPDNSQNKKYEGLILPLGYSPEPLILSILAIKPKRVGLLYTNETERLLQRIQGETQLTLDQLYKRKIDGSSTVDVYKAIMELYEEWERPSPIAVDITGGKKSMVGGAAMAGAALEADIFYVDNTKFTHGKPEPCTEYLSLLDNPYTVFGNLEVEKARDLYGRHDYAGAQRVFDQLKEQVGDPNLAKVHEAYGHLCAAYEAWDNLDIGKAKNFLNQLLKILKQYPGLTGLSQLCGSQSVFEKQVRALDFLLTFLKNQQLALAAPDGFHFAFTLYYNACRREAQGKLDIACLILYRLLEWIGQHRLKQYKIETRAPDYSEFDENQLFDRYRKKQREVYQDSDRSKLPAPIGLIDGYFVLDALEDDIVENLDWDKFRSQIETRNQSIYAHGMKMIDAKGFKAFKLTLKERFKKAQESAGIDADAFNEQHKFIEPLP